MLETATAGRAIVQSPYEWSKDTAWKDKVLTKEQPFLDEAAKEKWLAGKAAYKSLKDTGDS